jgi:hypothetical protein
MRSAGPGDDQTRFLTDLRALRDTAAIGHEELAARAHYPSDVLKEAEYGPRLPTLPVLTAYVRACEGNVLEWEERWRRLGDETRVDPNLPVRPAGASPAAAAGARAGVGVSPPEAYDPARIKAALRGEQGRPANGTRQADRAGVAEGTLSVADGPVAMDSRGNGLGTAGLLGTGLGDGLTAGAGDGLTSGLGDSLGTGSGDGLGSAGTLTAGNGLGAPGDGLGMSGTSTGVGGSAGWENPIGQDGGGAHRAQAWAGEAAEHVRALRDDQYSTSWFRDQERVSWSEPDTHSVPVPPQTSQGSQEPTISQASWTRGGALSVPEPASGRLAGQQGRDWPEGEPGNGTGSAAVAQPRLPAEPPGSPASSVRVSVAAQPSRQQQNGMFTWRLLALLVVAALLGSLLVLLIK